ncbi:hypothetical protein V2J09_012796, partial [Rumex salicifolius]
PIFPFLVSTRLTSAFSPFLCFFCFSSVAWGPSITKLNPIGSAKMIYCAIQRSGVVRSRDDVRSSFAGGAGFTMFTPDHPNRRRQAVVCPKPRRVGVLNGTTNDPSSSLRRHLSHQAELLDSQAGSELMDIILSKGGHGSEKSDINNKNSNTQVGLSPPFFSGSPPSRVSNPLIQDARFREEKLLPSMTIEPSPTSSSARKGGFVRANFGNKPAIRVEGFHCLDRDRSRNCSIPASA